MPDENEANTSAFPNISHKTLAILGEMAGAHLFIYKPDDQSYYVTPSFLQKFSPQEPGPFGKSWNTLVFPADRAFVQARMEKLFISSAGWVETDCRMLDKDGNRIWVRIRARHFAGQGGAVVGSISELDLESHADAGTGLLNQRQFEDDFATNFPEGENGYLVLMGVDNLRIVNEQHGLHLGNQVLKNLADCLEKHASPFTRVYRLDGDRFATVLADKNEMAAGTLYTQVKREFAKLCSGLPGGLYCTISAGAAGYPDDSPNFRELFQFAESALNNAKRNGKNKIVFFSRETYEEMVLNAGLREALQQSVQNGFAGFEVFYQPQISAKTGQVCGAEALLRWQHKLYGRVPPDVVVPILESTGFIGAVGRWVLEQAMEQCRRWRSHTPDFTISVNLSHQQLENEDVPGMVHAELTRLKLPGNALTLELVENLQLRDFSRFNEISAFLSRMGVSLSIDDFGTGYSSLGYIKELDVHQIKVDKIFVSQIRESAYNYELIHFLIKLARDSGSTVCVEGVETREELEALLPLRPDSFQGYYFGRPTDAADFERRFLFGWRDHGNELRRYYEAHPDEESHLDKTQFAVNEDSFLELLDALPELAMLSDRETCEILFLNSAGRSLLNVQHYQGLRCHQLLYGQESPCPFCEDPPANRDSFVTREYDNEQLGGRFLMRHKLIPWKGKLANFGMSFTPAEALAPHEEAASALTEEQVLGECVRILAQEEDAEFALHLVLKSTGEYYRASRAYLFSFEENSDMARCTHEWLAPGVPSEKESWSQVPCSLKCPAFYARLQEGQPVVSGQGETFRLNYPHEYEDLCRENQSWLMLAPVQWKGRLIGCIGVDRPGAFNENPELLRALSIFLAQEYALREMRELLFRTRYLDSHTGLLNRDCYQKDMDALLAHRPETPFGAVYLEVDGLKELVQAQGHTAGDLLLQRLAATLREAFPGGGCRYYHTADDAMAVLCPGGTAEIFEGRCTGFESRAPGECQPCTIRTGHAFEAEAGADVRQLLETAYGAMRPL